MYHTHTNIFPYLTDWMSNPFDRVVCGDFSGKSHFSTSYCNSPLRSFCAIDPTSSENSRQAGDRTKSPVPYLAINSRQEDAWLNKSESAAMATNLNLFFFFLAGPESQPTGWCWRERRTTKLVSHTHNATLWERRLAPFALTYALINAGTPLRTMPWRPDSVSAKGEKKKATALNSIMEWKKGKKVLSLFSKSQHMAFVVWLFKVFSFRSAMAGKFMLIVMGKNLTQQHPGARLSEDLNSKWNGRTGFFSSTQQLAADLETPLRCARRAIVSHLLLYDLGAVFRMHTPWHDYFRFWWSSVCVCAVVAFECRVENLFAFRTAHDMSYDGPCVPGCGWSRHSCSLVRDGREEKKVEFH